jgi:hypothetical protein
MRGSNIALLYLLPLYSKPLRDAAVRALSDLMVGALLHSHLPPPPEVSIVYY